LQKINTLDAAVSRVAKWQRRKTRGILALGGFVSNFAISIAVFLVWHFVCDLNDKSTLKTISMI
jgi:hypothetical protein